MRLKGLAEISTMHYFAQLLESKIENWGKKTWPKQPRKGENERLCNDQINLNFFVKNVYFGPQIARKTLKEPRRLFARSAKTNVCDA